MPFRPAFLPAAVLSAAVLLLPACQSPAEEQTAESAAAPPPAAASSAPPPAPVAGAAVVAPVKVVTVAAGQEGETYGRFELPQVQLPDAAVAARLNQAIVAASFVGEDDWQGLSARQAVQRCLREYQENDHQGLTSLSYSVVHNDEGLLTLARSSEYMGAYPSADTRCLVFDVRSGRRLTMGDLAGDTTALRRHWRAAISRRVAAFLQRAPQDFPDDSALVRELPGLLRWNAATRQVDFDAHEPRFYDFAVTRRGLTLTYSFGFPHVIQAAEPEGDYSFTYAELRPWLRPAGPLAPLLR
ncbi:hypothetical protein EJV47_05175 [Hymenobacter gummosus]|uniref:DUF3298 domain-containing protein n=1 Tax=Hymenobacter gummosus TaxID=1776032 RepID=A0A431U6V1_9BACT|nr:hypothetical protein [Hymenobacter gummosus]RTQ52408.1 hypothetical protein EJV47_05175 [Hymenobacter gummosus]